MSDRLSTLSDDLLHHILSFLPSTKDRAQTSLISRRFRHLWAHHPSISLSIPFDETSLLSQRKLIRYPDRHLLAVDASLRSFRAPALHSLSLDLWLPSADDSLSHRRTADGWLRFAAARSVRSLSLKVHSDSPTRHTPIPSSIFACRRSLTDLEIENATFPPIPPNFPGFRFLRTLYMALGFMRSDDLADLLAACPALEKLVLIGCYGLKFVEVCPQNLPRLEYFFLMGNSPYPMASVWAQNLKFFRFSGDLINLEWKGSPVLHTASVRNRTGEAFESLADWIELVSAVSNAKVLTVNNWFYQFEIPKDSSRGPMFKNLKELNLDLDWLTGSMLRNVACSLGECPLLEELYVEFDGHKRSEVKQSVKAALGRESNILTDLETQDAIVKQVEDEHEWDVPEPFDHIEDLGYSLQHLRKVTLREFLGSKNEMRLAEFLLARAAILEEFVVYDFLWRDEVEFYGLFATLPRASSHVWMKLSMWEHVHSNTLYKKTVMSL